MAYVANYASGSVTPIQLPGGQAAPPIAAGRIPARLAVSPDGATVYVLDSNIFGGMGPGMSFSTQVRMLARVLFSTLAKKPPTWRGQVIPIHVATNSAGKPIKVGRLPIAIAIAP
jgi:DNA-binding beta-propeller fold protein YncE